MNKEERFKYARDVMKWTCDENGNVYNKKNKKLGYLDSDGYVRISLWYNSKAICIKSHQFIFWYFNNKICDQIDHINCDRTDNRIFNLREINNQKNQWNRKEVKGYYFNKRDKKFCAQIMISGKLLHLGYFNNEIDAHQAYLEAKKIHHVI